VLNLTKKDFGISISIPPPPSMMPSPPEKLSELPTWLKKPEETKKTSSSMTSSPSSSNKFPSLTEDLEPVPPIMLMMDLSTDLTETIPKTELML